MALAAVSSVFRAAMEALNATFAVEEGRPYWRRLLVSMVLALAVTALLVLSLA